MKLHRLRHDEKGQTATELALVLPVLCVLLFGVIQFGILYNNYITLTDAARAGARKAAVSRQEADPAGVTEAKVRAAAEGLDQDKLVVAVTTVGGWEHGADVKVTASYPYEINLLGWAAAAGNLSSSTTERVE
jgi:Flp pilus assembly protein TadG